MPDAPRHSRLSTTLRIARIAASYVCLTACIAFAALGVRSYSWNDTLYNNDSDDYAHVRSWLGRIEFRYIPHILALPKTTLRKIKLSCWPADEFQRMLQASNKAGSGQPIVESEFLGFGWGTAFPSDETRAVAPHWFFALVAAALALALKPKPRLRLSLRELLAIITIAAVVLTAVCSLQRWTK
jgi:hypothetical protein